MPICDRCHGLIHGFTREVSTSELVRESLAVKRAQGVRLGRPAATPPAVLRRVVRDRDGGQTWQAIADGLNADGVPTIRGGAAWRVSSVQGVYRTAQHDAAARTAAA